MSIRVSLTSLIAGKIVVGVAGHGVLAQLIPSTGDFGPGLAYSSLSFPADNGKEIRVFITTQPTLGTLYVFEDTSFTYDGPNGTHTFQYQVYVDGVALGSPQPGTVNVGVITTNISIALVGEDAVISGAITAGSAQTDFSIALVGEDAVISAALSVAAATSQITMAVLGEDAVISASLLGGVLPVTPGSAPTSSTASTRHSLKRLVAATDTCVTLAEAKLHCRVDGVLEDFLITAYIQAATEAAEQLTGRAIMPQIWQLTHDGFPALFELTRPNVLSVVSLTYIDAAGATQSLTPADYSLDASDDYGFAYVVPAWDVTWPAAGGQMNSVVLTYQAGYASAAQVPASVKAWVLLMTAALYNNRELEGTQQTHSLGRADVLLDSVKVWSI